VNILADTNVVLRMLQTSHPDYTVAADAIRTVRQRNHQVAIVPQVLYEYWVVATRPIGQNGFGLSAIQAEAHVDQAQRFFRLYRDERRVFRIWRALVVQYQVLGKQAHDARLVAAMERHGLGVILTFNANDFSRYKGIRAISPRDVVAGQVTL
jgi:predicted nucleic acid-binding protein